jgi:hypothetical protein
VAGVGLRAGLTGRKGRRAGGPGLHPGLVELALQAGIARGCFGVSRGFARDAFVILECDGQNVAASLRFGGSCASGFGALPVLVHSRHCCVFGL